MFNGQMLQSSVKLALLLLSASASASKYPLQIQCEPVRVPCACGEDNIFEFPVPMCPKNDPKTGLETCQICNWRQYLDRDPCSNFQFCKTCSPGLNVCVTCPEGYHGKFCQHKNHTIEEREESEEEPDSEIIDWKDVKTGCVADIMREHYVCRANQAYITSCEVPCQGAQQDWKTTIVDCDMITGEWGRPHFDDDCTDENISLPSKTRKKRFLIDLEAPKVPIIGNLFGGRRPPPKNFLVQPPPPPTSKTCPSLMESTNLKQWGTCVNARSGDSCYFKCNDGFVLQGSPTIRCTQSGQWMPLPPVCARIIKRCPTLRATSYVKVSGDCGDPVPGNVCNLECVPGYQLMGPATIHCNNEGQWEPSIPTCQTFRSLN